MKLIPLADRVVVRRAEADTRTRAGILLPDNAKERPTRGEVLAVGPGKLDDAGQRMPMSVRVGQVVLFGAWNGHEIELDGEKVMVLEEKELLGILE